jgi:hypothetical protein
MANVIVNLCVLQNRDTKKYKRLTLETESGQSQRFLFEDDTDELPTIAPSTGVGVRSNLPGYEKRRDTLVGEAYDIVTER